MHYQKKQQLLLHIIVYVHNSIRFFVIYYAKMLMVCYYIERIFINHQEIQAGIAQL